jgi:hypothetical protein
LRAVRISPLLTTVLAACACGSSSSSTTAPASSAPTTLQGTVSDRAGDALPNATGLASPDLTGATISVSGGNVTLTVTFAPGTLTNQTVFYASLDTDENVNTGRPGLPGGGSGGSAFSDTSLLGVDYEIAAVYPRNSGQATVFRVTAAPPAQPTVVGTATLTFPAADQARIVVPLSMLGNDDGRMAFKVTAQLWVTDTSTTISQVGSMLDYMPDTGQPVGLVR